MPKYHNKKVTVDGIKFDSKHESARYCELKLLEKAGLITSLQLQVPYIIIPKQIDEQGKTIERECRYIADFVYCEKINGIWQVVVEDAKGMKTEVYKIKRKLMLYRHNIRVRET